jgi:mycofactocin precursor peptide peptidase
VTAAVSGSRLASLAWTEVPPGALLLVPVGSCEQHGPHLPLDTDLRIAVALASAVAAGDPGLLVGPSLTVGASGEHQDFPGTLSIGTPVLAEVIVELARSALPEEGSGRPDPFTGVLFVNGHGGNIEAFGLAVARLRRESRRVDVWHPRVDGGDSHAGRTETSLLLHLDPGSVQIDRSEPGSTARWREIGEVVRSRGLGAVTPNGVLGDPTTASAEEGAIVMATLVQDLSGAVDRLRGLRGLRGLPGLPGLPGLADGPP